MTDTERRNRDDSETFLFAGGRYEVLQPGCMNGRKYALMLATEPAGNATPPHYHDDEWEFACILDGALKIETGGQEEILLPGDIGVLPPREAHRLSNPGPGEARYLLVTMPAEFEQLVRSAGQIADRCSAPRAPSAGEIDRLVRSAGDFGVRLVSEDQLKVPAAELPQRIPLDALGGVEVANIAVSGEQDGDIALLWSKIPSGGRVPLRSYAETMTICPIDGAIEIWQNDGGGWRTIAPGHVQEVRGGVLHEMHNRPGAPCQLVIITQQRVLRFFEEACAPVAEGLDEAAASERFQAVAARFAYQAEAA
jgi:quercetin dioxygenase-like cupin family protein